MQGTMDKLRSVPPGPFRCRLQRPATIPHVHFEEQQRQALRRQRSSSTMTCELTARENAQSDSGPLRPASVEEVIKCDVRVSSVSGAVGYSVSKPIPAFRSRTEPGRLNHGRSRTNFDVTRFVERGQV